MNILMMTNTYLPHVGGVARSVSAFTNEYRSRGHRVVVVAPEYKDLQSDDEDVIRIPAIQNFNGSDFSVVLPVPGYLQSKLKDFKPDVIHSNHPFLIGSTAVRIASKFQVPLVYTHHTQFEQYLHYVPVDLPHMKTFVINLAAGYSGLADQVIAPSRGVALFLREHGVQTPIAVIPTGVHVDKFTNGNGRRFRLQCGIPEDAFVIGHVGRLAPEKNLKFLAEAIALFMQSEPHSHFIAAGSGPEQETVESTFKSHNVNWRVHLLGKCEGQSLVDAYHSMDVFAFSSKTETQGLVLMEAMAAGKPVIALDACGVREIIRHKQNGFLVFDETAESFACGLMWLRRLTALQRNRLIECAKITAADCSIQKCAQKVLTIYENLTRAASLRVAEKDESLWHTSIEQIKAEWDVFTNFSSAVTSAIQGGPEQ